MEAHILKATIETCKQHEYCKTCPMRGTITCKEIKSIYNIKRPRNLKIISK